MSVSKGCCGGSAGGGGTSAEYVPTFTPVAGTTGVSLVSAFYSQIGNMVTVAILADVTQGNFAADQRFDISLPVAGSISGLSGVVCGTSLPGSADQVQINGMVAVNGGNARVTYMGGFVGNSGTFPMAISFSYYLA